MAATVSSSVWGTKSKPGAWALEAEEHDSEQLLRQLESSSVHPEPPSSDFPSLATAISTKSKKKKPQKTLSLSEFTTYSAPKSAAFSSDELLSLPTGPRERSAEDLERSRSGFGGGGGFRNYGYDSRDSANSRSRVSERGPGSRDRSSDDGFSRADEADDWSKSKRYVGSNGGDRREKVGFFNSSRADEVDNWASNKSFTPSDGRMGRRMVSDSFSSGGADSDNWGRKKEERESSIPGGQRRGSGFEFSGFSAADSENWVKNKDQNSPVVVDGGRPRLNLQRRTLPVSNGGQEVKPKGSNPFGDARPREEVLKEKGQDWKEIDDKLEALKVKEGAGDGVAVSRGFGNVKEDLMEKRSWRKSETQDAPTASADNVENEAADNVEKEGAEKAEEVAAEKTETGDAENN